MLKALELVGFKSFADRTRFDFPTGITAVVGPNGSGKSNVVDAIKWVLGEQSVKSLRGKEMADVIFNGSASRAPQNYAETTLTLDNSRRQLPIDAAEVLVTRRVYRNGEGEYMLNRQACRLRDIRELFSGTGVATEAYSVIEQGKVDVLLQSSPRDRRLIFEEAAGISRFKAKKLESLRRLERVEQNLLRLGDIVAEVEHRLRQVRLQAAKARRYQEYSTRLEELRTHVAFSDWTALTARLAEMDEEHARLASDKQQSSDDAERCDGAAAELETQLTATADTIRAMESRAAQLREAIATRETTVENQLRRGAELDKETARLRRQLAAVTVRVGGLEQQLAVEGEKLAAAERDHLAAAEIARKSDAQLAAMQQQLAHVRQQAEHAQQECLAELRRASQWESEASSLTSRLESARSRLQQYRDRLSEQTAAREAIDFDVARFAAQEQTLAGEISDLEQTIAAVRMHLTTLTQQQNALQADLATASQRHAAAHERVAVLEEFQQAREGYSDAVKDVLAEAQSAISGPFLHVRGVVAELLKVSVEMAPLIEAVLGTRAQHLVVNSLDDILAALAHSPQHFAGQVTFIPIDLRTNRSPVVATDLHHQTGVVGRADQFVETSAEFVPLARRLLGNSWIVESLERGVSLARKYQDFNFVTLAGEVVTCDGAVSIGPCAPALGLISRRSELDQLSRQVNELAANIGQLQSATMALTAEIEATQQSLATAEQQHAGLDSQRRELRLQISASQQRAAQVDDDIKRNERELGQTEQVIQSTNASLETTDKRLSASRATIANCETRAATLLAQAAQLHEERTTIEATAAAARVELAKCEERLANLRLRAQQLEQDQLERRRTVADAMAELALSVDRSSQSQRVVLAAESELAELYLHKEHALERAAALLIEQHAQRTARSALLTEALRIRAAVQQLDERLHSQQLAAHEVRLARINLAERMREDYDIDLAEVATAAPMDDSRSREEIDQEIAELRRKIAHIGNVNLEALSELDELEGRFAHLSGQHQDLASAKQSLVSIIDRINTDSRRLFAETLEKVRQNFQTLFRKLFGGGQADIVLDEGSDLLESGIEIVARPPGKEPRSISLLSGGEKTLTCVALLLAIFQYRPSPFCILDEVDAALDEANIERFITVLQEFLAWTQFVVVTHSKKTMTCATTLYGVTMQESGVSKRVAVRFEDVSSDRELPSTADDSNEESDEETQAA